ncbi:protein NRT1/ PTR FAMILY 2.3-like [Mercurialis annua]|uniref:protein NRT1/ PTR FAMILY 2.3-like n=1 Tax=Mercurialis annua TaxID=3986 RepID=UPI00215FAC88|nr:protein NRT1/ PTR FAMILY 2.3-like [Mercurialis annua]
MEETNEKRNRETSVKLEKGGWDAAIDLLWPRMWFIIAGCGVSANLLYFLMSEYNVESIAAIQICCFIFGCVFMVGIAGVVADYSFFGSFRVITVLSFVSLFGMIMLMLTRLDAPSETPTKYQFGLLFVSIALALSGFVAVYNSYGFLRRDQYDKPPTICWELSGACLFFYVNVGAGVTLISLAGQYKTWGFGFGSCCFANVVGLLFFFCKKRSYRLSKPQEYFVSTLKNSGVQVDELFSRDDQDLIKLIPLFVTDIFLHASDIMLNSLMTLQALTMNRHIFDPDLEVPVSCFAFFSLPTIFLSLAIIDFFVVPQCKKLRISWGIGLTHVLTILTLIASAVIESHRLNHLANNHSLMSALWLMIPEAILGFKFGFYFRRNSRMYCREEGIATVLMRTFSLGMGCFVSILIIQIFVQFTDWLPHNINDGRLDYVYWMLAAIGCLNFAFHLIFTKNFEFPTFEYYAGDDDHNDEAAHGSKLQVA